MGKREKVNRKWRSSSSSPCMQPSSRTKASQNWVWVPKIPSWEKEFCYKIGSFKWENFVEAKMLTRFANSKILQWDDAEAKEAFHRAKNRFFARINNLLGPDDDDESIPGPDLYIDAIDWDDDEGISNPGHVDELDVDRRDSSDEEDANDYVPDYYHVRIEDIKPTGWDVDVGEISRGRVLTGLIVGR